VGHCTHVISRTGHPINKWPLIQFWDPGHFLSDRPHSFRKPKPNFLPGRKGHYQEPVWFKLNQAKVARWFSNNPFGVLNPLVGGLTTIFPIGIPVGWCSQRHFQKPFPIIPREFLFFQPTAKPH